MSVFVLTQAFDYEGESPVGVYARFDDAMFVAQRKATDYGYESAALKQVSGGQWEIRCGSTQWIVRTEKVIDKVGA